MNIKIVDRGIFSVSVSSQHKIHGPQKRGWFDVLIDIDKRVGVGRSQGLLQ